MRPQGSSPVSELVLDLLLVAALLATAGAALLSRDLFRAVVLFVAFGLLMALGWVRLEAPDIALAEAAIGAGLTGVLLLDAVSHFRRGGPNGQDDNGEEK
jgi:energy-converting hydrogenase B subunit D